MDNDLFIALRKYPITDDNETAVTVEEVYQQFEQRIIAKLRKPLTDQEICDIALSFVTLLGGHWENEHGIAESKVELFARAIERAHGIGGE